MSDILKIWRCSGLCWAAKIQRVCNQLDGPKAGRKTWQKQGLFFNLRNLFDETWVLGKYIQFSWAKWVVSHKKSGQRPSGYLCFDRHLTIRLDSVHESQCEQPFSSLTRCTQERFVLSRDVLNKEKPEQTYLDLKPHSQKFIKHFFFS